MNHPEAHQTSAGHKFRAAVATEKPLLFFRDHRNSRTLISQ